ncbi:MAG TPA: hypothetical protein VF458_19290 [Ktedonobacteraceae bacterium]
MNEMSALDQALITIKRTHGQTITILCAWCLVEQSKPLGTGSHGICTAHADRVRQQARARRAKQ